MTTAQHRSKIDKLTTEFANLGGERRELDRVANAFQSAFKNPYSDQRQALNERWDDCVQRIKDAVQSAIDDGTRPKTVAKWLDCVNDWNIIKDIQQFDCGQF